MEFASGQIGILETALAFSGDDKAPKSKLEVTGRTDTSTTFTFSINEPANVYYTLDGSRPTLSSPKLVSSGMREGSQQITVNKTTQVRWFSVDIAGNVENDYKPAGNNNNYKQEKVEVRKVR